MLTDIHNYHQKLSADERAVCEALRNLIQSELPDATGKVWHGHPVWFIDENPIVGYSLEKKGVRLMFWSGADFVDHHQTVLGKKFKDASVFYASTKELDEAQIAKWMHDSKKIQWDYKNIVKRKGKLEKLF